MRGARRVSAVDDYATAFAAVIVWSSVATLHAARSGMAHHPPAMVWGLAGAEMLAATAFPFRAARGPAGRILAAIFTAAVIMTAMAGEWPVHLVFYACTVGFILALGRRERTRDGDSAA
ncbi:MAG: hypothetical protein ACR2FH_07120 [Caulobacteraceae bacterium]